MQKLGVLYEVGVVEEYLFLIGKYPAMYIHMHWILQMTIV